MEQPNASSRNHEPKLHTTSAREYRPRRIGTLDKIGEIWYFAPRFKVKVKKKGIQRGQALQTSIVAGYRVSEMEDFAQGSNQGNVEAL